MQNWWKSPVTFSQTAAKNICQRKSIYVKVLRDFIRRHSRNWRLLIFVCVPAGLDGFSYGGSVGELRSTCFEDFPPGLDFESFRETLSQADNLYPDSPPRYQLSSFHSFFLKFLHFSFQLYKLLLKVKYKLCISECWAAHLLHPLTLHLQRCNTTSSALCQCVCACVCLCVWYGGWTAAKCQRHTVFDLNVSDSNWPL